MRGIRTWAWPDPKAVHEQLIDAAWGGAYWKQVGLRKAREHQRKNIMKMGMKLVPLVRVSIDDSHEEAPAAAPVVH